MSYFRTRVWPDGSGRDVWRHGRGDGASASPAAPRPHNKNGQLRDLRRGPFFGYTGHVPERTQVIGKTVSRLPRQDAWLPSVGPSPAAKTVLLRRDVPDRLINAASTSRQSRPAAHQAALDEEARQLKLFTMSRTTMLTTGGGTSAGVSS